jgi:hypothetical protein
MRRKNPLLLALVVLAGFLFLVAFAWIVAKSTKGSAITFTDWDPRVMKLRNRYYEVAFDKTNGAIRYVTDLTTGQPVSAGNLNGKLWSIALLFSPETIDAAQYSPDGPAEFQYSWSGSKKQLVFHYLPDPEAAKKISVTVTITATTEKFFDLQIAVENNTSYATREIRFPGDLVFAKEGISGALLPVMPGIVLKPGFFNDIQRYETTYPGYPGVFADFMALSSKNGQIALYTPAAEGPVVPTALGYYSDSCTAQSTCYIHAFRNRVPAGGKWTSPQVRVSVSATWDESIERFRVDDGIAALPGLEQKLGDRYEKMAGAVHYKADTSQLGLPFSAYADLLAKIPYPGLLHPVGYGPLGFDRSYPDFIPPKTEWGTTQDMADMFRQAQSLGFLVMPYTNPTWWDEESPTLKDRPANVRLADFVALDDQNRQLEECYGCPESPHYGVVVSPYAAFVQERLKRLNQQITTDVPSDFVFEDQIGARPPVYDNNPASPAPDAYMQGWLAHTQAYSGSRLMTELGFDRLLATEVGLHGSALLPERLKMTDAWWGAGDWAYYPFVTRIARDKVLFYQHNLAPETFTFDAQTLTWNLAMGYMLSYDLFPSSFGGGMDSEWLRLVGACQKEVLSRYANERVMGFAQLEGSATQTEFEKFSVIANWDGSNPLARGTLTLAPNGVMVIAKDGSLVAGSFTRFNDAALSAGEHYLIVEYREDGIKVMQPVGGDTSLSVKVPADWQSAAGVEVTTFAKDGSALGKAQGTLVGDIASFDYMQKQNDQTVEYYLLAKGAQ